MTARRGDYCDPLNPRNITEFIGNSATSGACPGGLVCHNGACIDDSLSAPTICTDSDGDNPLTKGTVADSVNGVPLAGRQGEDYCTGSTTLMEYVCNPLALGKDYVCSGQCREGACAAVSVQGSSTTFTGCGNGVVSAGEGCDDGNVTGGDGCSATCTEESGWQCSEDCGAGLSDLGTGRSEWMAHLLASVVQLAAVAGCCDPATCPGVCMDCTCRYAPPPSSALCCVPGQCGAGSTCTGCTCMPLASIPYIPPSSIAASSMSFFFPSLSSSAISVIMPSSFSIPFSALSSLSMVSIPSSAASSSMAFPSSSHTSSAASQLSTSSQASSQTNSSAASSASLAASSTASSAASSTASAASSAAAASFSAGGASSATNQGSSAAESSPASSAESSGSSDGTLWSCPTPPCDVVVAFACGGGVTNAIDYPELFKEELLGTAHRPNGEVVFGVKGGTVISGSFTSSFGFEPGQLKFPAAGKLDQNEGALLLEIIPVRNHQSATPHSGILFWTGVKGVDELELSLGNIQTQNDATKGTLILRRIRGGQELWRMSYVMTFAGGNMWNPVLIMWGPNGMKLGGYPNMPESASLDVTGPLIPVGTDLYLGDASQDLNLTFRNFQLCGNEAGPILPITAGFSSASSQNRCRSVCHRTGSASSTGVNAQSSSNSLDTLHCGNGRFDAGEECETNLPCSGIYVCNDSCRCVMPASSSPTASSSPAISSSQDTQHALCGNGLLEAGEQCDIGQPCFDGAFCSSQCTCGPPPEDQSTYSTYSISPIVLRCGNGLQEPGEECDDGNRTANDGCSPSCRSEFTPTLIPSEAFCGNGHLEEGEECEIGTPCPADQVCAVGCRCVSQLLSSAHSVAPLSLVAGEPFCGNGILEFPEECDIGPVQSPLDSCSASCLLRPCTRNDQCPTNLCVQGVCIPCTRDTQCSARLCMNGVCIPCLATGDCSTSQVCQSGSCYPCTRDNQCMTGLCTNGSCIPCSFNDQCATRLCVGGACVPCDTRTPCPAGQMCQHNACALLPQESVRGAAGVSASSTPALATAPGSPSGSPLTITFPTPQGNPLMPSLPQVIPNQAPYASVIPAFAPDRVTAGRSYVPSGPAGQTGPASLAIMVSGAAAGWAWMRRKRRTED